MPTRRNESSRPPADPAAGTDEDLEDEGTAEDNDTDVVATSDDVEVAIASPDDSAEEIDGDAAELDDDQGGAEDEDEDEEDDTVDAEVEIAAPARPAARPSPGRPPSAKEEPEPPFFIGERVRLVRNTRPRTGSPIADHPVGATGRVETVLSQTAIVRFDRAPDTKEVVAFTCLESLDEEAMARRAERDRQAAKG